MALDFRHATNLFLGTEKELALALGIAVGDVRAFRQNPERVPPEIMQHLGKVLVERGLAMERVGRMLAEDAGP
ncbi:MAG TPA: hypothetical protein VFQ38_00100 [Longimicrobiales bacterium]|nr:hypothetical protein [Longimicrobiales bacterium]